jgi:hypothetical protein
MKKSIPKTSTFDTVDDNYETMAVHILYKILKEVFITEVFYAFLNISLVLNDIFYY